MVIEHVIGYILVVRVVFGRNIIQSVTVCPLKTHVLLTYKIHSLHQNIPQSLNLYQY